MSSKGMPMPPMGRAGDNDPDDQPGAQPQQEGSGTPNANYTGPENQCNSCQYFDGKGKCSNQELLSDIPDGTVDPAGRCDEWEAGNGPKTPAPGGSTSDIGKRIMQIGQPGGGMAASDSGY